ncbi:MAG: hypothetical protein Q8T11_03905 [Elusimicrobiota bacterium]|nr:hypothetical protein [Elusimicrobiota bacterium]
MVHRTSSSIYCQIFAGCLLAAAAAPARAEPDPAPPAAEGPAFQRALERFAKIKLFGAASINWRNVGPREPGFETQIQNQVYLSDMYLGAEGPVTEDVPVLLEWNLPTAGRGVPRLSQAYAEYNGVRRIKFQLGKFMVPFGRYNELYRPDQYLAVTRPLLYASPDTLDLVVRPNSPRPPLSYGYSDIGLRWSWYPVRVHPLVPSEATLFVVNGVGEQKNRLRTFPNPSNLGIPGPGTNGVTPDFGHENHNLADNNNAKTFGGRIVFALGDLRLPWPVSERASDMTGTHLGLSGMGGNYDLEGFLGYEMWSADWSFDYKGVNLSGEAMYSRNHFLTPRLAPGSTEAAPALASTGTHTRQVEHLYGYFLQASFPLMRRPPWGRRVTGLLVYNEMYRRGPLLDFLLNFNDGTTTFESMTAYREGAPFVTRRIRKYTAGLHWQLAQHFAAKFEYSYWVMGKSTVRSANSLGLNDIYQGAFSLVMGF